MHHPEIYIKIANEYRRLGEAVPDDERRLLLEHADG
jgi:hypothetical protein